MNARSGEPLVPLSLVVSLSAVAGVAVGADLPTAVRWIISAACVVIALAVCVRLVRGRRGGAR